MEVVLSKSVRILLVCQLVFLFSGLLNVAIHCDGKPQFFLKWMLLAIGNGLYIAFSSLLLTEVKKCGNNLLTLVLATTTALLILHTICGVIVTLIKNKTNTGTEENEDSAPEINASGSDRIRNALRQPIYFKFQAALNIFERHSCIIMVIAAVAVFLTCMSTLFSILVLAVSIKIATIDRTILSCSDGDKHSSFILISIFVCMFVVGTFGLMDRIENIVRRCRKKETSKITAFRVLRTLTSTVGGLYAVIIYLWLVIRMLSVFQNGQFTLFEFISLGIFTPLTCVFMNQENEENDMGVPIPRWGSERSPA